MKTIDLFCASPASTAICSSMDQRSMVRRGTRPLDRHRHSQILGDGRKSRGSTPCPSQLVPVDHHQLYNDYQKSTRKSTSSYKKSELRRKSSADVTDLGSSRYLLSDTPFYDPNFEDSDHLKALVPSQPIRSRAYMSSDETLALKSSSTRSQTRAAYMSSDETLALKSSSTRSHSHAHSLPLKSSSTRSHSRDQIVELRVSIHCKGCEGKVRKHISRMEGVRSFNIDLATKKVTVIGDVTPLGVLTSISRVKTAQFWPSPTSSSSSYSSSSSSSSSMVALSY